MAGSDPLATLNPSIVGQAEKAHAAILKSVLAGTGLDEQQWITLQLAVATGDSVDRSDLVAKVSAAAKYEPAAVHGALEALVLAGMIEATEGQRVGATATGRQTVSDLRSKVAAFVGSAYGSIPPEDLATTARVLIAISARLSEKLAQQ